MSAEGALTIYRPHFPSNRMFLPVAVTGTPEIPVKTVE